MCMLGFASSYAASRTRTMANPLLAPVMRFLGKLSYPRLFALTAGLFVLDVFIPDMVPFADELLLGLATLLLGNWKRRRNGVPQGNGQPPIDGESHH